jgi:hypothetical protein
LVVWQDSSWVPVRWLPVRRVPPAPLQRWVSLAFPISALGRGPSARAPRVQRSASLVCPPWEHCTWRGRLPGSATTSGVQVFIAAFYRVFAHQCLHLAREAGSFCSPTVDKKSSSRKRGFRCTRFSGTQEPQGQKEGRSLENPGGKSRAGLLDGERGIATPAQ